MSHIKSFEQFINESFDLKSLSKEAEKDLEKVRKLAKKYGYVELKNPQEYAKKIGRYQTGITHIAFFIDPNDSKGNTFVNVYLEDDDSGDLHVNWYYWSGPSGNDSIEYWTKDSTWKNMLE